MNNDVKIVQEYDMTSAVKFRTKFDQEDRLLNLKDDDHNDVVLPIFEAS